LSEPRPVVLKIGGSVITDKNGELAAKTHEINRLAEEIQTAGVRKLIIISVE
jgi:isopentenyl phosphate kinase